MGPNRNGRSRASRRAGFAPPGRARPVQVERPTGRTTRTRRARSGCLWCAAGERCAQRRPRLLSLGPATVAALRDFLGGQRGERAFFKTDYRDTDRVFTWGGRAAGAPGCDSATLQPTLGPPWAPSHRLHDIRHSYATASLKANVNPKIVSQRLGHALVGFTLSVYFHARPGVDREAAGTIADLILGEEDDR